MIIDMGYHLKVIVFLLESCCFLTTTFNNCYTTTFNNIWKFCFFKVVVFVFSTWLCTICFRNTSLALADPFYE